MRYRPDIDGLRALAVLLVIFYHLDLGFPGGYVGVDVFFVISGYLICQLLLRSLQRGDFSWPRFWERRVRRLLPALSATLAVTAALGWWLLLPDDLVALGKNLLAQPLLLSNAQMWYAGLGYFGDTALWRPTMQTWSLAVEEQFYLFFPGFVLLAWRRGRLARASWIVLLGSLALSIGWTARYPHFAYLMLPTRAWELLLGAVLAQLHTRLDPVPQRVREPLAWLGLGLIVGAALTLHEHSPFPGWLALLPCLGSAAVIGLGADSERTRTRLGELLSHPLLVAIGLASYSLFLWHWPLAAYARYLEVISRFQHSLGCRLSLLGLSLALGFLSWRWIETPFRSGRVLASRRRVFLFAAVCAAVFLGVGGWFTAGRGLPERWPPRILALQKLDGAIDYVEELFPEPAERGEFPVLGARDPARPIQFLFWADSHGLCLYSTLDRLGQRYGVRGLSAVRHALPPLLQGDRLRAPILYPVDVFDRRNQAIMDKIRSERIPHVLLVARWERYLAPGFEEQYRDTLTSIRRLGAQPWVLLQVPKQKSRQPARDLALTRYLGLDVRLGTPLEEHVRFQQLFQPMLAATPPGVEILDPTPCLSVSGNWIPLADGDTVLYLDGNHLTSRGGARLSPLFEPLFARLGEAGKEPD